MIGTRVGNYEIKEKLGEGGMGAVYMGEHPLIGKRVAIKVLLDELTANEALVTRFFHEAKAANDIRHQNIVDIVDFGKMEKPGGGGNIVYLVMELLEGQSLATRLDNKRLTFDECRHVLAQCCSGLAASHAKGIIHRDLKPDNLFLVQRGSDENFVKILDFGIAKLTVTASTSAKTRTGTLIGTPAYMSPEQCAGRGNLDARSDIYALGIVMYEMLTGHVPFKGEGFGDIVVAHLTEAAKKPSEVRKDVPPELDAIVMKAIEKEPEGRFQSMEEFGVALRDPATFAQSPGAVAYFGAVAAAPTTSVPVVDDKSGPRAAVSQPDAATIIATKKKNTTLSGAASESAVREAAKAPGGGAGGRRTALFGGIGVAAAAVAVVAVVKLGGGGAASKAPMPGASAAAVSAPGTSAPTTAPVAAVAAPKPPEQVEVSLKSDPPGAQVVRSDGVVVGMTPVTMKLDKGSRALDVQLSLEGYRSEKRTLTADVNREVDVNLLKERSKHAGNKAPAVAKPGEAKPAEAKPAEAKPAEKPAEKKPSDPDKDLIPAQL
ncbi:MAG TPA: serine/threonine-protein kinase [Polyangia bacterium]|nr:serine/threonine-protein kinase [Polyangia bacterium]